ncbi:MAG TPA: M20 family metallopeptidase [Chitinophagales bacterium]|nr:amidohydrolase [Chitinophagales bacterium]HMU98782.1 M20 family metallopeptidase [Chitinophagales bacterium]HMV02204.1 M20 family metallopeptidase [Chitinophagales bacterium]HMW93343.1 M20 family metallopeptidase [Chitinophagales bacterium]HMY41597.1 M20 family metallopeptidase [Chitinophagales bacterium]
MTTSIIDRIKQSANEFSTQLIEIRRHLHTHPELSFEEKETAKFIATQLDKLGITYQKDIGGHGIVGLIKGNNPDQQTIALRADIDALPIHEKNKVSYCSVNEGKMHACGHDVHTTCLIGALKVLNEIKDNFEGQIKFIFQPAEEKLPGGASILIQEGVLENPKVEKIFGEHVLPQLETGKVAFRSGISMASCDEIFITIKGNGGHGAVPNLAVDTVLIASHIVIALQQIVSRNANPIMPSVLTIGKFIANGATNVIPEEVKMEGTFRTFDEKWRADAKIKIVQIATSIAESMGAEIEIDIAHGYPFLKNDEEITQKAIANAKLYLGEQNVEELPIRMTAEDFSYYTQVVPACFYRLGTGNIEKGITSSIHTPTFDVDENCLEIGAGLMAWLAFRELSNGK